MPWDDDKDTGKERPSVPDAEKITSAEWNNHVDEHRAIYDPDAAEVVADVNADSVSAGEVVDASSGNSYDVDAMALLNAAGFSSGDVVAVWSVNAVSSQSASTTNTTYENDNAILQARFQWDDYIPDGAQGVVKMEGTFAAGTGEDYDVQLRNDTDIEEMVSITSPDNPGAVSSGWTEYTPSTTDSPLDIRFRHRTNPGSNSSQVFYPHFSVGVEL